VVELQPAHPLAAIGLSPRSRLATGVEVEPAPVVATFGLSSTHGSVGLPESLAAVLGHGLDRTPNRWQGEEPMSLWTGPDRWLVIHAAGRRHDHLRRLEEAAPRPGCVVNDLTDGLVVRDVLGPNRLALIAHGCSLDLEAMAPGTGARTLFALQPMTLAVMADRVRLIVDRSLLRHLWLWLDRHLPLMDRPPPGPAVRSGAGTPV
jgi:sarcosine oxidase subunit gamma